MLTPAPLCLAWVPTTSALARMDPLSALFDDKCSVWVYFNLRLEYFQRADGDHVDTRGMGNNNKR